jgi:ABC-type Fe3+ transport system permease subunit
MASVIAAVLAAAAGAGVMWIFIYGDNPWPSEANTLLVAGAATIAALVLAGLLAVSYRVGRAREVSGGVRRSHVFVALGLSIGLPLLVLVHQWQVGNLGNLGNSRVPPNNSSKPTPLRGAA